MRQDTTSPARGRDALRILGGDPYFLLVFAVGLFFIAAIGLQIDGFNGPWYFKWPWHDFGIVRTAAMLALALPPFYIALRKIEREDVGANDIAHVIAWLMIGNAILRYAHILCYDAGFAQLATIVESDMATSYFTDASAIRNLSTWLAGFPPSGLHLHSLTHPPGPILYYFAWIKLLGPDAGALAGGAALGVIATLSIPVFYAFSALWTQDRNLRLWSCLFYALTPATIFFFPEFDQVYPLFAMFTVLAWTHAVKGSRAGALAFGASLVACLFFAYNLLVIGAFLLMYTICELARCGWRAEALRNAATAAALAIATVVLTYTLFWLATGYSAPHNFIAAIEMQARITSGLVIRPWAPSIVFDLYDFFLGLGVLAAPLLWISRAGLRGFEWHRRESVIALIGLAFVLIVDISGLLRGETSRVWLFLQPFVIVPIAAGLLRFDTRQRRAVLVLQWCVAVVLTSKIAFLG